MKESIYEKIDKKSCWIFQEKNRRKNGIIFLRLFKHMNKEFQAFVFDMDGTIVNTNEDICDAVNFSLEKHGLPTVSYKECESYLGNGSVMLIKRAMKGKKEDQFQSVFDVYYEYYLKHSMNKTKPYPGILESLQKAKEEGILLFVYTNKPEKIAQEIVDHVFPKGLFSKVVGVPLGGKTKPDPLPFIEQTKDAHLNFSKVAYYGDSVTDIQTAHNLGCGSIFSVLWGYQTKERLMDYPLQPTAYLDDPKEIMTKKC